MCYRTTSSARWNGGCNGIAMLFVERAGSLFHLLDGSRGNYLFRRHTDQDLASLANRSNDGIREQHWHTPDLGWQVQTWLTCQPRSGKWLLSNRLAAA